MTEPEIVFKVNFCIYRNGEKTWDNWGEEEFETLDEALAYYEKIKGHKNCFHAILSEIRETILDKTE